MNRRKLRNVCRSEIRLKHFNQKVNGWFSKCIGWERRSQIPSEYRRNPLRRILNIRNMVSPTGSSDLVESRSKLTVRKAEHPEGKGCWRKRKLSRNRRDKDSKFVRHRKMADFQQAPKERNSSKGTKPRWKIDSKRKSEPRNLTNGQASNGSTSKDKFGTWDGESFGQPRTRSGIR